jgi:hypothetical protein
MCVRHERIFLIFRSVREVAKCNDELSDIWNLIFEYFPKSVKKIPFSLKSDKNNDF